MEMLQPTKGLENTDLSQDDGDRSCKCTEKGPQLVILFFHLCIHL